MSDDQARRRWKELADERLHSDNADEIDALAERLGITIEWRHLDFSDPDAGWKPGRYER